MKLRRLAIESFRNVRPGTEIEFDDGINVVLGKNGSGKTSLLEILGMLAVRNFSPISREAFGARFHLEHEGVPFTLTVRNTRHRDEGSTVEPRFAWDYEVAPWSGEWTLRVTAGRPGTLHIGADELQLEAPSPFDAGFWGFALLGSAEVPASVETVRNAGLATGAPRFDEELGFFHALVGDASVAATSWGLVAPSVEYRIVLLDNRPTGYGARVGEAWLSPRLWEAMRQKAVDDTGLTIADVNVPFLREACDLMGFETARLALKVMSRNTAPNWDEVVLGPIAFILRRGGHSIGDRLLSYGQKRLLSYLFYADSARDFVIADELANGMHYDWIRACLEAVGDKQGFFASQNPLLMDHLVIRDSEQVRRSFVLCSEEDGTWVWRNMTSKEAERFHAASSVGIQHVSEILRTRGLW